jgi:hypothetical protein
MKEMGRRKWKRGRTKQRDQKATRRRPEGGLKETRRKPEGDQGRTEADEKQT